MIKESVSGRLINISFQDIYSLEVGETFLTRYIQAKPMVSEKQHEGERLYICDVCGFGYRKKDQAANCEEFCARTNSCSIAITKDAVYFPEPG
jgi:hypothetical protein|tara:strand:- start:143 stop:421 length:279 start_codon:yes stop_codon:yes gene_type:complete